MNTPDILTQLMIPESDWMGLMANVTMDCVDPDADFADTVIGVARRSLLAGGLSLSAQIEAELRSACMGEQRALELIYGAAVTAIEAQQNMRPNRVAGLFGPEDTDDFLYPADTIIPMTPRIAGASQSDLVFTGKMAFYRLVTNNNDINAGWNFCGGRVMFSNEVVGSIQQDTPFGAFDVRSDAKESPLAAYMFRYPGKNQVTWKCAAIHNRTEPQILFGATIEILDNNCRVESALFEDSAFELGFSGAVLQLVASHRKRCRRLRLAPGGMAGGGFTGAGAPAR